MIDPTEDMGVGMDFLVELNLRIDEDESVTSMVTKAAADMSSQLSRMTMNDDYKQYINVCFTCSHNVEQSMTDF